MTMVIESYNKASISITGAKSIKTGLKETERTKACTRIIRKKSYELALFLQSYKEHTFEFAILSGGCKVVVDNKSIRPSRTNLLIDISKLISYALAQLIWCSYFI